MKHIGSRTIETERLILRKIRMEDAQDMFTNWACDPEVTRYLTWPAHARIETTRAIIDMWLQELKNEDCYRWCLELKDSGKVIGCIDVVQILPQIESAMVGYCMGKAWWNKGIMTEALIAVEHFLLQEVGFNRVEAYHHVDNPASGRVMEKSGMKFEGIRRQAEKNNQGELCDVASYAILKDDLM